jgi:signal peptidase I
MSRARAVAVRAAILVLVAAATAWALSTYTAVYVGGDSMSPALVRGDLAVVRRDVTGAKVGDILLVTREGWPGGVLHRVIAVTFDGRFQLRGDANPVPDLDPVPASSARGVVAVLAPTGRVMAVIDAFIRMVQSRLT